LVPVPLHPRKLAERGYNQSALLARALGRELRWRVRERALRRCRDTQAQAELGRNARLENVSGALIEREELEGMRVVLVDDVVTTGATASVCREALGRAGAIVIAVAAVARA
jgi:ComF family protein